MRRYESENGAQRMHNGLRTKLEMKLSLFLLLVYISFEGRVTKKWAFPHKLGRKEHKFIKEQQFCFPTSTFRTLRLAWTLISQEGISAGQVSVSTWQGEPSTFLSPLLFLRPYHVEQLRSGIISSRKTFSISPRCHPQAKLHILSLCSHSTLCLLLWLKYPVTIYASQLIEVCFPH